MMFLLSQNMHILKTAAENEILSLYGSSLYSENSMRKSCFYGPAWLPKSSMWYDSCLCCCWSVNQLQRRAGTQSRSWRTAQERISDLFPPLSDWNLVCGLTHLWDHKTNITCSLRLSMQPLQPLVDYFQFQYICMGHLVGGSLFSRQ